MSFPPRTTSLAATATAAAASVIAYPFLPRRVATHFDADGRADRYSSRTAAALTLPAVMMAFTIVNRSLGGWPGGGDREDAASGAQTRDEAIGLIQVALLPAHLAVLANGVGVPVNMSRIPRVVYGVLMIAMGNVMPKLPRNGLIGVRTPWTLADPVVWERTHRLGGYLVIAAGFVTLASLPTGGKRAERLSGTAVLGAVGLSAAYSFILYRRRHRAHR